MEFINKRLIGSFEKTLYELNPMTNINLGDGKQMSKMVQSLLGKSKNLRMYYEYLLNYKLK